MKKLLTLVAVALLASPAFAIDIPGAGTINFDFSTAPAATDFATGGSAGASADVGDDATFDTEANTVTAASIAAALTTATGSGTLATWRYDDTADYVWTRTTGNAASYLKATLNNTSPNYVTDLSVSFNLGEHLAPVAPSEQLPGLRMWYSTTGDAGSWTALGNFTTVGAHTATVTGLGTNFPTTMYLMWGDDNGDQGADAAYNLDNVSITPTFGGPKVIDPPTPEFGTQPPPAGNTVGAGDLDIASQTGGVVLDEAGNNVLHLNNGSLSLLSEQVDLRGVDTNANQVRVSIDLRTLDSSDGSDFETSDSIQVTAEWSADGLAFTSVDLYNQNGGETPWPSPADELKLLDTGAGGAFTNFSQILPANAETVRIRVTAVNNSATENFYFDNLNVSLVPVPEPATIAMFALGMVGLVGYRRRRSA